VQRDRWPDLFVVGAPRAGTTSLWQALDVHPQVFMSRLKEPHYFTSWKPLYMPHVSDRDAYLRLFSGAAEGQLRGEATPSYLAAPEAAEGIARASPEARIVVSLREPVARAYSDYLHKVRYGVEDRSFLEAVRSQAGAERVSGRYLGASLYADSVERYLERFPGRVHVLFLEELATDPPAELRRLFAFLGVDATPAGSGLPARNPSGLPRNALARRLYRSPALRRGASALVPGRLQERLEGLLLTSRGVPPLEPEARRLLDERLRPERPRLESLLGRPVPWP
jgi:hypothetical protein